MNLAVVSVCALVVAIILSCVTQLNVGIIAIAFAWIIGVYLGGFPVKEITAGFPAELFLTLAGVTLLFAQTQVNGTLDGIAQRVIRACRGNAGVLPVLFFLFAAGLASIGPGNIATAALLAPAAMASAQRMKISPFLMAIMVGNGANSGSLSPLAPTGIIVNGLMDRIGLGGHALTTWITNLGAHAAVAFAGFLIFGGWRLFRLPVASGDPKAPPLEPFHRQQWITMAAIATLVGGVLLFHLHIGMAAFTVAAFLSLLHIADDHEAIRRMPWSTLLMVSGVTVLIALLEKTQGIELFAALIARISTPDSVTAVVAGLTGLVSAYSSTSGVVLPAFLPTIPSLLQQLGGGNPLAVAAAMNVGSHLVDVSPLSTIGALCIAGVTDPAASRRLFYQLLAWGLSMCLVGALFSWVFFR
jgi:Na+/H+ antiporter NhaD/arsenite permease-like protein